MKRKILIVLPFLILVLGFLVMRTLSSFQSEEPRREPTVRPKIVETTVVELGDIPAELVVYGRMASKQPITLMSEVSGTLIQGSVPFQPGQNFRRGDLLIKIDDRQMRYELNSAKSDLLNALASVLPEIKVDFPQEFEIWQTYFNKTSFDEPLSPIPDVQNQKIKLFLSRFNVYKLYFAARNLEIRLEKHFLYAPFDGSIVSVNLRAGSTARSGSVLGEIINLQDIEMEVPIPVQDIEWIDQDADVRITSKELSGEWKGRINRIGSSIDERTQSVQAYISVDRNGDERLVEGVFLQAEIPGKTITNAISIPRRAVYEDQFVYLIENGQFKYRPIDITFRKTDSYIVNGGVANGDTLVTELLQGVAPGMPARAKSAEETGDQS